MKTIQEKLDNLLLKLKEAKTLEEAQKITQEIENVKADADKVTSALDKANKEAKEHRESKQTLEKEIEELKKKKEPEDEPDKKDKDIKPEDDKKYAELLKKVEDLSGKLQKQEDEKQKLAKIASVKKKLEEVYKSKEIPESKRATFNKYIDVNSFDPDADNLDELLGEKVVDIQKDLKQETLDSTGKPAFPGKNPIEGLDGKKIAEMRNAKSTGQTAGIKTKTLPGMKTEEGK